MNFDDKIKELNITLPEAKPPVGSYVAAKIVANLLDKISECIHSDNSPEVLISEIIEEKF